MPDVSQGPGWWMASDHSGTRPSRILATDLRRPTRMYSAPLPRASVIANYGQRLGGWLIDWLILLVIGAVISALTHSFHYTHMSTNVNGLSSNNRSFRWGMPGVLLSALIIIVYGALMCGSRRAQTVGMMVTGIKAVKLSTGEPIGYGAALGHAVFEWFLAVIFFFPGFSTCCSLCGTPRIGRCTTRCPGQMSSGSTAPEDGSDVARRPFPGVDQAAPREDRGQGGTAA